MTASEECQFHGIRYVNVYLLSLILEDFRLNQPLCARAEDGICE